MCHMIRKIYAKNFRSIGELTFDLSFAEGKAPNDYEEMERLPFVSQGKSRCPPVTAVFGPNAAGKSNIVKALIMLMKMMRGDFPFRPYPGNVQEHGQVTDALPHDKNQLLNLGDDITLGLEYSVQGNDCLYKITYNGNGIKDELFSTNGNMRFHAVNGIEIEFGSDVKMPSKEYTPDTFAKALKTECVDMNGRPVRTFASLFLSKYAGLDNLTRTCLSELLTSLMIIPAQMLESPAEELGLLIDSLSKLTGEDKTAVLSKIVEILKCLDLDIQSINITEIPVFIGNPPPFNTTEDITSKAQKIALQIKSVHRDVNGELRLFDFLFSESDGTIRLAVMIARFLYILKRGGTLCVDELEKSLHPVLVRELLKLFKMRQYNSNNAQLIFTTHLAQLLDDTILRLSEVAIVDKNRWHGTTVRRLTDMKVEGEKIRNVTNFRKRYLMGYYSGVPHAAL